MSIWSAALRRNEELIMTDLNRRYYHLSNDILDGGLPELMNVTQISDAFERLSAALQSERDSLLSTPDELFRIVENLSRPSELWRTKAQLLTLEDSIGSDYGSSVNTVLSYLFDMMFYGPRSIRRAAASAAGNILAAACQKDMSVWTEHLHKILFIKTSRPSESGGLSEDPLRVIFLIVYAKVPDNLKRTILNSYAAFFKSTRWDAWTCLRLISGIFTIPVKEWGAMQRGYIGGFIRYFLRKDNNAEVRIASLYLLNVWLEQGWRPSEDFAGFLMQSFREMYDSPDILITNADNVLIRQICTMLGTEGEISFMPTPDEGVLFKDNMRADRSWIFKLINLLILRQRYERADIESSSFSTYVAQLMILLRLNPDEIVFQRAGEDILELSGRISDQQKYEIVKDLLKILETGYDETGYVPDFLGRFFDTLSISSRIELFEDIQYLASSPDPATVGRMLETVCGILKIMSEKADPEEQELKLFGKLCGLLRRGMYSDDPDMVSRNLFFTGYSVFSALENTKVRPDDGRNDCYADLARDTLICMKNIIYPDIMCHTVPVRHISGYLKKLSSVFIENDRPVAFFSSSFDPFSNGHRAIVREIADMGLLVYINVHNFAWNRNMQPMHIRRQIAAMSVTDMANVRMFPEEISVNTENPEDLKLLSSLFPGRKVWLVMGSDRVENDLIYKQPPYEGSVHSFPHIIFVRNESSGFIDTDILKERLSGDVITLKLPVYYEHMTSREIRRNIQEGKSIEGLVSRQIKHFIERHNLYSDNRFFKPDVVNAPVETETGPDSCSIYLIKDGSKHPAGTLYFRECTDEQGVPGFELTGKEAGTEDKKYFEILLDETMMVLQKTGRKFCTCPEGIFSDDMLERRGFIKDPSGNCHTVRIDNPILLFTDVTSFISDDLDVQANIMAVAGGNARRLQKAAAGLYPGNLVLTVISELLNYRLGEKIRSICCADGNDRICVPFGKILKYVSIPDVVMMPLSTEKRYDPELTNFNITEKTGYPALPAQIRTIRSMNRPFVLVDDLYHKGYRMDRISASLKEEGIREDCLIVGVLSDRGRALAEEKGLHVEAAYEVPNLRLWINASDMIPFFGTDKIDSGNITTARTMNEYPSIYTILPYQFPSFLKDAPFKAVYDLSETCIENAMRLFDTLEGSYRDKYHRTLTFSRLSEVIEEKGYPEEISDPGSISGKCVTELLKNELVRLRRLR